jgi:Cu(I)/Ag(I) efflux system membrane protein CusA/SilA
VSSPPSSRQAPSRRVEERLKLVVPFTILLILFLLYANTKSLAKTLIVVLAVPFSVGRAPT